jgi:hypothetical protein
MKSKQSFCKKCGAEITNVKGKNCEGCGAKIGKPIFKKWWFWVIIIAVIAIIASTAGNGGSGNSGNSSVEYEKVELQQMFDDLNGNALKAENTYKNKYVEVRARIVSFDSNGSYISVEALNAGDFNLDFMTCYIKNDAQRNFLMEKSVGDIVTIKGKVTRVGEVLGYSLNIDEVK